MHMIAPASERPDSLRVRTLNVLPFATIHVICLGVIWVGWSWTAVGVAAALYLLRMFVITAFYHRYFSHRTFDTHRVTQFVAALIGTSSAQRGPIWWAAHHRHHHTHSDDEPDIHSPTIQGVIYSHLGWFNSEDGQRINWKRVPDLAKYPELVWLDRFHLVGPIGLSVLMFALGALLARVAPGLGTDGWQMFVWGFGVSTTVLYHSTFTINSLAHAWGSRRFNTKDDSRNNFVLALLTLGEGWHNNHHYFPGSARQGFYWWEIDITYYALRVMQGLGLVRNVRAVPTRVYEAATEHASERDSNPRTSS